MGLWDGYLNCSHLISMRWKLRHCFSYIPSQRKGRMHRVFVVSIPRASPFSFQPPPTILPLPTMRGYARLVAYPPLTLPSVSRGRTRSAGPRGEARRQSQWCSARDRELESSAATDGCERFCCQPRSVLLVFGRARSAFRLLARQLLSSLPLWEREKDEVLRKFALVGACVFCCLDRKGCENKRKVALGRQQKTFSHPKIVCISVISWWTFYDLFVMESARAPFKLWFFHNSVQQSHAACIHGRLTSSKKWFSSILYTKDHNWYYWAWNSFQVY